MANVEDKSTPEALSGVKRDVALSGKMMIW